MRQIWISKAGPPGVANLASLAAYPVYCFPHYGSCPVYLPY